MKEKNEREPAYDDEFNAKFIDIDISLNAHTLYVITDAFTYIWQCKTRKHH